MIDLYKTIHLQTAKPSRVKVYGIERDITDPSTKWTRTDAAVGKVAEPSIGEIAGKNDFNDCYPWSEMKRQTFSTGDVVVKIPEFYYQRTRDGNIERIKIADKEMDGFTKHPGSGCYISAYNASLNASKDAIVSVAGAKTFITFSDDGFKAIDLIDSNKDKYSITSIENISALQMLYLVEYAEQNIRKTLYTAMNTGLPLDEQMVSGMADGVANLNGVTSTRYANVYRGLENIFSEFSCNIGNLKYDKADGMPVYTLADKIISKCSLNPPFIKTTTLIDGSEWAMLPQENGGDESTYCASKIYGAENNESFLGGMGYATKYGLYGYTAIPGCFYKFAYKAKV